MRGRKKLIRSKFMNRNGYFCQGMRENRSDEIRTAGFSGPVETERTDEVRNRLNRYTGQGRVRTNWWRTASFDTLKCTLCNQGSEGSNNPSLVPNEVMFNSMSAREAYNIFIGRTGTMENGEPERGTIVDLARLDAWMTVMLLSFVDISATGRTAGSVAKVMYNDYRNLKLEAVIQIQKEIYSIIRSRLTLTPTTTSSMDTEFEMTEEDWEDKIKSNSKREYVVAVPFGTPEKVWFVVKPRKFQEDISKFLGPVLDAFVCYRDKTKDGLFYSNGEKIVEEL